MLVCVLLEKISTPLNRVPKYNSPLGAASSEFNGSPETINCALLILLSVTWNTLFVSVYVAKYKLLLILLKLQQSSEVLFS